MRAIGLTHLSRAGANASRPRRDVIAALYRLTPSSSTASGADVNSRAKRWSHRAIRREHIADAQLTDRHPELRREAQVQEPGVVTRAAPPIAGGTDPRSNTARTGGAVHP